MLTLCLVLMFFSVFSLFLGFMPMSWDSRPKLQLQSLGGDYPAGIVNVKKKDNPIKKIISKIAILNKPLIPPALRKMRGQDLSIAKVNLTVEEFFLIKEVVIAGLLLLTGGSLSNQDFVFFWAAACFGTGYYAPEFWLKGKVTRVKEGIIKELPDAVDLLALCVNAGLDFMMALKYLIEKSSRLYLMQELSLMIQEINVGKPRREALRDLARKYELPDLSTFARTLIQADRMGTSVSEALNILSEDMRVTRFRRGEATALKAPLKMLVPLMFFIFPVVGILVAGPVFLDFMTNNPFSSLGGG